MNGQQPIAITLDIEQWREVYRILNRDRPYPEKKVVNPIWKTNLQEIKKQCEREEKTCIFSLGLTWSMSATVRRETEEIADEISRQMSAQIFTEVW